MFNTVFMARRLFLVATLTLLVTMPTLQIAAYLLATFLSMHYLVNTSPYNSRMMNVSEKVNEIFITLVAYHLFCFTDYVSDLQVESSIGWSMISVILLNVLFNIIVFIIMIVSSCKLCCKRRKAKKAALKHAEEVQARLEALKEINEEKQRSKQNFLLMNNVPLDENGVNEANLI